MPAQENGWSGSKDSQGKTRQQDKLRGQGSPGVFAEEHKKDYNAVVKKLKIGHVCRSKILGETMESQGQFQFMGEISEAASPDKWIVNLHIRNAPLTFKIDMRTDVKVTSGKTYFPTHHVVAQPSLV